MKFYLFVSILIYSTHIFALDCPTGKFHVRQHHRRSYFRGDGTFVKATNVKESCRDLSPAFKTWMPRIKSGKPPSWPQKEPGATWSEEQKERVIEAIEDLPAEMQLGLFDGIYRLSKSIIFPNPSSQWDRYLVLYDTAFLPNRNLARILAHEFAHQIYSKLDKSSAEGYRKAVGWKLGIDPDGSTVFWSKRSGDFVEADGRQGPKEDFANNLEYFLFEPNVLRSKTPRAFDWFKARYGDNFKVRGGRK
jgi:hypothetical protein